MLYYGMKYNHKQTKSSIEELHERVRELTPPGWVANQGFFLCMDSMKTSPKHISVSRQGWKRARAEAGKSPDFDRVRFEVAWREQTRAQAAAILATLRAAGLDVRISHGDIYVMEK
jgi:hypothetical protein